MNLESSNKAREGLDCWNPDEILVIVNGRVSPKLYNILSTLENEGYKTRIDRETPPRQPRNTLVITRRKPWRTLQGEDWIRWEGVPHLQVLPDLIRYASKNCLWHDWVKAYTLLVTTRIQKQRWKPEEGLPLRPPPFILLAEAYYTGRKGEALQKLLRFLSEGADIPVLGDKGTSDKNGFMEELESIMSNYKGPLAIDTWNTSLLIEGLENGAWCGLSLTPGKLAEIPRSLREEKCFVLVPDTRLSSWKERVEQLLQAYEKAENLGYRMLILDPILYPPFSGPGAIESLVAAFNLGRSARAPLMLGLHNVYELMDADTPGQLAVLVALAGEIGVSAFLVGEESVKAYGSVLEARLAIDLIGVSMYYGTPPKDYPLRLLFHKNKVI